MEEFTSGQFGRHGTAGTPLRRDPYEGGLDPELGTPDWNGETPEEGTVAGTGTTTVGLATEDGVAIATDTRASLAGRFVANKNVRKVEQIHPTAAMTLVGSVGGAQSFIRSLRAEADLYEARRGEDISIEGLATLAGNFARGGPYFAISPILGGVDDSGSHVFSIDPAGGVMSDDYVASGSGLQLAYGVLEGAYDPGLSMEGAEAAAVEAVEAASERDTASGDGVTVARVSSDGVGIERLDDADVSA
ncbi:proteasome subunit beta [Halobacteriales archaeon QS_8_69_26]|nr:MAG: proteasome subunit beta [Halobacteriales archaeon QS_8_69_26]